MSDKLKIIIGALVIVLLLVAIVFVYLSPKTLFNGLGVKNKQIKKVDTIVLNEDFKNPDKYTEITINDIVGGRLLKAEQANSTIFDEDTIPLKFKRVDVAYNQANLVIDEGTTDQIKKSPEKSPFKNSFFYKIKNGDVWYTILGQQIQNSDGSTSFLHFLIHKGEEVYSWGRNSFFVEPMVIVPDQYFTELGPREFFSADKDYYMKGGKIDNLINSWLKTGIVPDDLQKEVLLMTINW